MAKDGPAGDSSCDIAVDEGDRRGAGGSAIVAVAAASDCHCRRGDGHQHDQSPHDDHPSLA
jgi:hypothetical protein